MMTAEEAKAVIEHWQLYFENPGCKKEASSIKEYAEAYAYQQNAELLEKLSANPIYNHREVKTIAANAIFYFKKDVVNWLLDESMELDGVDDSWEMVSKLAKKLRDDPPLGILCQFPCLCTTADQKEMFQREWRVIRGIL